MDPKDKTALEYFEAGYHSILSGIAALGYPVKDDDNFAGTAERAARGAERYVHYLHGVNPLSLVYLSNMEDFGAVKSVTSRRLQNAATNWPVRDRRATALPSM